MTNAETAQFSIQSGFPAEARAEAARLFWQAFSNKLGSTLGPETRALPFLHSILDPGHAISALSADGKLLGIAGFKTADGAFVDGGLRDLAKFYGWFGALWRGPLLHLLERPVQPGQLLMDGIFVREEARGMGVGSALLGAISDLAEERGLSEIRLDVIDTNPRARALYERRGFEATGTVDTGPLRHLFRFNSATTMVRRIQQSRGR